jgi:FtsH-binding integral membrane protein
MHIYILIAIWSAGIATAAIALFLPDYSMYVVVGAAGWITVAASSGLILYEIKRIRAEDRKKELA